MQEPKKLTDALSVIQRAEEHLITNADVESYVSALGPLVETFKQRLSHDTGLALDFFSPVDPSAKSDKAPFDENTQPANPDLSPEASQMYWDLISVI